MAIVWPKTKSHFEKLLKFDYVTNLEVHFWLGPNQCESDHLFALFGRGHKSSNRYFQDQSGILMIYKKALYHFLGHKVVNYYQTWIKWKLKAQNDLLEILIFCIDEGISTLESTSILVVSILANYISILFYLKAYFISSLKPEENLLIWFSHFAYHWIRNYMVQTLKKTSSCAKLMG